MKTFSALLALSVSLAAAGPEDLYRLDLLPRFRQSVKVAAFSSYDRTGGNDDGFSGKYSFLRKEGDALVIAQMEGPGVIYRVWTPTPTDDPIEFYFDGETAPRIRLPFRGLFTGENAPFLRPIVGSGGGGYFSYLPIAFAKSCKVLIRAPKVQFYQINYAIFPPGEPVSTYAPDVPIEKARQLLASAGSDITSWLAPPGAAARTLRTRKTLAPASRVELFSINEPGRVLGLRLSPASAFAGKDRAVVLRIYWDGDARPAVNVPAGDLFGYAWGRPAARSLVLGTSGDTDYLYLPMPFDRSARIELASDAPSGAPIEIAAEAVFAPLPRAQDEGRFYAVWHRENPTSKGRPFTFLETPGRGHIVGTLLQAQGTESGNTYFFEGDDQVTLDGQLAIHGTGSEDAFNGGWYDVPGRWYNRFSFPLSGCLDYLKPLGRTGAYRFFLTDAYAFRKSALFTIEHAPTGNSLITDYAATTLFYLENRPTFDAALPPVAARRVSDPARIVFTPGWSVPVYAFSFQNATLSKRTEKVAGAEVRYLSLLGSGEDMFGAHFVSFLLDLPSAGKYRILIEALRGPGQGTVQLSENDGPAGVAVDLHAPVRGKSEPSPMATLDMQEGSNVVTFKLTGSAPRLDLISIVCEKQP